MSLSEQEQRALREIEQSLLAEDPRFGASVSGGPGLDASPVLVLRGVALGVLGLVMLVGGVALAQVSLWFIALSVAGFLLMFGAGVWVLRGSSAGPGGSAAAGRGTRGRGSGEAGGWRGSGAGSSVAERMEQDFRRRFE
ncbi:DUF3040 domain-containing protein [Corynebacterium mastitidis]